MFSFFVSFFKETINLYFEFYQFDMNVAFLIWCRDHDIILKYRYVLEL